jgi:hypothetical protein
MIKDIHNIYDLIAKIKHRPAQFLLNKAIGELETYLLGYLAALSVHDIEEEKVPDLIYYYDWLKFEHHVSISRGWAYALLEKAGNNDEAMNLFFSTVQDFSKLVPKDEGTLKISNKQTRTKQFLELNSGLAQEPLPSQVKLFNLSPSNYCYLTYYYGNSAVHNRDLYKSKMDAVKRIKWEFNLDFE